VPVWAAEGQPVPAWLHRLYDYRRLQKEIRMTTYKKPDSDAKRLKRVNPTLPTHAYDGKELRPFTGRPGAMNFKKCPSRGLST